MVEEYFKIDGMVHAYMLGPDIEVEVRQGQPLVVVSRKNLDGSSRQACKCLSMDCSVAFLSLPHIALVLVLEA